tara:strand:- start:51 stop:176 length:126 start_codon:yes stop_codon:yes gene_type:complete
MKPSDRKVSLLKKREEALKKNLKKRKKYKTIARDKNAGTFR